MEKGAAIALTIAGSDSGGGAGIQADLKTFSALGVYGTSVITALTAQNTQGVQGVFNVPPEFVTAQISSVLSDINVQAVKIGMLSNVEIIQAVAKSLNQFKPPNIVLDPVMVATSGDRLLQDNAIDVMRREVFPLACIITPNLHEAAALLDEAVAFNEADMERQAFALIKQGAKAVLIKGGHSEGIESVDILVYNGAVTRFALPRVQTKNTHGTGCTLSSAIAAYLSLGFDLIDAVMRAKIYISGAIAASDRLQIRRFNSNDGHGPTHHFYKWW
jgi:hydroxymethylpyrimidine/phosphomethylpyrimidine kinase